MRTVRPNDSGSVVFVRELQERSDYAELVEKLEKEIDQLRSDVAAQRQQLTADDATLMAQCAALTDKVCLHMHTCTTSVLQCFDAVGWKGIWPVKHLRGAGVVICLERGADLHMAQLMPLPLTVSCFSKIQIGFTFLVPAHLGSSGQRAVKRVCVCVGCHHTIRVVGLSDYTRMCTLTFNGPLFGTTQMIRYQKGKTNLDFTEARNSEWQ